MSLIWEPDPRRVRLDDENRARIGEVAASRSYYEGTQYDEFNLQAADSLPTGSIVPEHEKKLAYSTQIHEAVDYLAAQIGQGFQVQAADPKFDALISAILSGSPDLGSDDDEASLNVVPMLREVLLAGDVGVHIQWDAETDLPWLEFWESEAVDFHFDDDDRFKLERVVLSDLTWSGEGQDMVEKRRRREWFLDPQVGCVVETWLDDQLESSVPAGLPMIPWRMWRSKRTSIRSARGASLVSKRVRGLADRFDAAEQLSYVIARYNSHGNLVVVGDSALLQTQNDARIRKDVADVLTFPGGTNAFTVTLPSDVQNIDHQRSTLLDALFSAFGIARIDATSLQGLGNLSGYALEIMNRKTDSTFSELVSQISRDMRSTLNLAVDVWAAVTGNVVLDELDVMADVEDVYPVRDMEITMGSGYIVDDVKQRDDYTAGLISRAEALRQRGYSDPKVEQIIQEIEAEKPSEPEVSLSPFAKAALSASALPPQDSALMEQDGA